MIIGIIGLKGSGKSTLAEILENKYDFVSDSFAKPVKDIASIIFNWDRNMLDGITEESREWREKNDEEWSKILGRTITPRLALQMIGTEFGRNLISQDIWIESLKMRSKNKHIVISDVRYLNEAESIKKSGGILIKIVRGQNPAYLQDIENNKINKIEKIDELEQFMKKKYPEIHSSDYIISLLEPSYTIYNDKDLIFLEKEIDKIIKS